MTIGEYVRAHGDGELAVIMMNLLLSLISVTGVNISTLNMKQEYYEMLEYVSSPMPKELEQAIELWNTPSEVVS